MGWLLPSTFCLSIVAVSTWTDEYHCMITDLVQISFCMQKYLHNCRLFVDALEELQIQISCIEQDVSHSRPSKTAISGVMKRVVDRAPSEALSSYVEGQVPLNARQNLAHKIDENCHLLRIVSNEIQEQLQEISSSHNRIHSDWEQMLKEGLERLVSKEDGPKLIPKSVESEKEPIESIHHSESLLDKEKQGNRIILASATLIAGLQKQAIMIAQVAADVTLVTSSDLLQSYAFVIKYLPYISDDLVEEVLSWMDAGVQL